MIEMIYCVESINPFLKTQQLIVYKPLNLCHKKAKFIINLYAIVMNV